jgi:hypothetical protein
MSERIKALLADLRQTQKMSCIAESAELGDTDFVRAALEAWWARPQTAAEQIGIAQFFLLIDREEAIRRAESIPVEDDDAREALAEFWRAANPTPIVETVERLAEIEAALERDRRSVSYFRRLIELAEAYLRIGALDGVRRIVARYDERDRPRRGEADNELRLDPAYLTLARIMLDANDPDRGIKLVYDICNVGRKTEKPKLVIAVAAHAFAVFGERDEAARLADLHTDDDEILRELSRAWIAIDRARSYDRAFTCTSRITHPDVRASALLALARYAFRIDHGGHVPLPDDAPQPPPRARLLDGRDMVPVPRVRMK